MKAYARLKVKHDCEGENVRDLVFPRVILPIVGIEAPSVDGRERAAEAGLQAPVSVCVDGDLLCTLAGY